MMAGSHGGEELDLCHGLQVYVCAHTCVKVGGVAIFIDVPMKAGASVCGGGGRSEHHSLCVCLCETLSVPHKSPVRSEPLAPFYS